MFTSLKTNMSSENQWLEDDSFPFEMVPNTTWIFVCVLAQKPRQLSMETFGHTKTLNLMHMFIAKMGTSRVRVVTKVVVGGIGRYFSSRIRRGPQQKDQLMVNWLVVFHQPIWKNMLVKLGIFSTRRGVWWSVFLGSPYERDCYLRAPRKKSQTTGTQTNN